MYIYTYVCNYHKHVAFMQQEVPTCNNSKRFDCERKPVSLRIGSMLKHSSVHFVVFVGCGGDVTRLVALLQLQLLLLQLWLLLLLLLLIISRWVDM